MAARLHKCMCTSLRVYMCIFFISRIPSSILGQLNYTWSQKEAEYKKQKGASQADPSYLQQGAYWSLLTTKYPFCDITALELDFQDPLISSSCLCSFWYRILSRSSS